MMQSRLAAAAAGVLGREANWGYYYNNICQSRVPIAHQATIRRESTIPADHSAGKTVEGEDDAPAKASSITSSPIVQRTTTEDAATSTDQEPLLQTPDIPTPTQSSPKLQNPTPVSTTSTINNTQQKRHRNFSTNHPQSIDPAVTCVSGPEDFPWPRDDQTREQQNREEQDDDKEYFKHHGPSPLSEIKVADTRKPITRATDSATSGGNDLIGWTPEQRESAEETLLKVEEIWRLNKMRGDPDAPQSRVLREIRGEDLNQDTFLLRVGL